MFNPTLKRREAILFFLIVVINGLKCIVSDIGLDTCARGRWRVEVSKLEMSLLDPLTWQEGNESTSWTLCVEVVLAIQHLLGYCILGETSQRRSTPVTKFSQPRAWISLKRASIAPQSKLCCVIPFFILIIFRSIIQFV